jgi:hypothetical protein
VLNQKWLPACAGMTDFFVMYGAGFFRINLRGSLRCLAKHMSIYISSHDKEFKKIVLSDYTVTKNHPEILPVPG